MRRITLGPFEDEKTLFQIETMFGGPNDDPLTHANQFRVKHLATNMFLHFFGNTLNVCNQVRKKKTNFSMM
jgi:hypothetical protein